MYKKLEKIVPNSELYISIYDAHLVRQPECVSLQSHQILSD